MTAVVFDLDGVLIDSESIWDEARRCVVAERGGTWRPEATTTMMGMSAPEWSGYLRDELGVPDPPDEISATVVAHVLRSYEQHLPLLPGAEDTVRSLAARFPLGLASSANREVIEAVLERSGLRGCFQAVVSSGQVPRGKPAPDVYVAAIAALDADPAATVTVEDSANGIRAAAAAGTHVVAVPNRAFPPPDEVLAVADAVLGALSELTPDLVDRLVARRPRR